MKEWARRLRGALGMGLTWAIAWAIGGMSIGAASLLFPGLLSGSFFTAFDAPLPALAVPGFFAGVFFSVVLGVAGRRRRFSELSLPRFAAWGAVGGILLTLFPFALVVVGLASPSPSAGSPWRLMATIGGPFVLLSAGSAAATLMFARLLERRAAHDGDHRAVVDPLEQRSVQSPSRFFRWLVRPEKARQR
jgi:hypothetical protein